MYDDDEDDYHPVFQTAADSEPRLFRFDGVEVRDGVRHYTGVVRAASAGPAGDRPMTISTENFRREGWHRTARKVPGWHTGEGEGPR